MDGKRQKIQQRLAFMNEPEGEAPRRVQQGTEPSAAKRETESPAQEERLMEEVCERDNLVKAWKQVQGNKGSPGVDGKTIDESWTTFANTGRPSGNSCFEELTSRNRCGGWKSRSPAAGSGSWASLRCSTD